MHTERRREGFANLADFQRECRLREFGGHFPFPGEEADISAAPLAGGFRIFFRGVFKGLFASEDLAANLTQFFSGRLQGRGFLFHRDDSFDAQNPFSKAQGSGKAPFSQQRFGGFLGGPVVHDKLHYFGAYEGARENSTNVITSSLVAPDQREEPATERGHQYFAKTDYQMNSQNTLSVRYRMDDRQTTGNGIGGLNTRERGTNTDTRDQDVVGNYTSVLTPVLLNELRVQVSRRHTFTNTNGYSLDGMPEINRPSGRFGKAQNQPQGRDENRVQFVDNLSYTLGKHDFKFGADISLIRADSFFPRNRDGNFTFATDLPFDANNPATYPTQYVVAIANPSVDLPNDLYSFFAQDQWRLRSNLTFNLGIRYDRERGFAKIIQTPDDADNFQPRLGVVWDPKNDGRTAIRGGYGHYVDQSFLNIQLNVAAAKGATEIVIANPGYPDPFSRGSMAFDGASDISKASRRAPPPDRGRPRRRARRVRCRPRGARAARGPGPRRRPGLRTPRGPPPTRRPTGRPAASTSRPWRRPRSAPAGRGRPR